VRGDSRSEPLTPMMIYTSHADHMNQVSLRYGQARRLRRLLALDLFRSALPAPRCGAAAAVRVLLK